MPRWPARVVFQPTPQGMVALLGFFLSVTVSRTGEIETGHFPRVALLAGLGAVVLLLWSARLACAVAWAPVAEFVVVFTEFSRSYNGWDTQYVIVALVLGAVSALCLLAGYLDDRTGGFTLVAFWFTGLTCVWYFLDDLRKIWVLYVLLLDVPLAIGPHVLKTRVAENNRQAHEAEASRRRTPGPGAHGEAGEGRAAGRRRPRCL